MTADSSIEAQASSSANEVTRDFAQQPQASSIETDRFCDNCGYNLLGQVVRQEPHTRLLMCRCPECGEFAPAAAHTTIGQLWLQRGATTLLFVWIVAVIAALIGLAIAQTVISFVPLEQMTSRRYHAYAPAGFGAPSQATVNVRTDYSDGPKLIAFTHGMSLAFGYCTAWLIVLVMPHWRRRYAFLASVAVALTAATIVYCIWLDVAPNLIAWGTRFIGGQALAFVGGGGIAALYGRAVARLIVVLILPPRLRPALSYLWQIDGKQVPGVTPAESAGDGFPAR